MKGKQVTKKKTQRSDQFPSKVVTSSSSYVLDWYMYCPGFFFPIRLGYEHRKEFEFRCQIGKQHLFLMSNRKFSLYESIPLCVNNFGVNLFLCV